MSREIEDMAKIMCQDAGTKNCNIRCDAMCDVHFYAEQLYKEGYRKQREGEWMQDFDGDYYCSFCAHYPKEIKHYCPNCGAKMRKEDEGK